MKNALPFFCIGLISLSGQLAELQAVRLIRVLTEALLAIFLVFRIVPVKEHNRRIAFKRHNVRSDAIEEPAVVADDQYAARDIFQTVFEGTHGVYVNIVRRFVKQDDVGTGFEHPGGVYAVPFAAGQELGTLTLTDAAGETVQSIPIRAAQSVERLTFGTMLRRMLSAAFFAG